MNITEQTSLAWSVPDSNSSDISEPFSDVLPEDCSTGGLVAGYDKGTGAWDDWPLAECVKQGKPIDLKPYLSRNAYSLGLDILASNVLAPENTTKRDRAFFSLQIQRSDMPYKAPDSGLWQVRWSQRTGRGREAMLWGIGWQRGCLELRRVDELWMRVGVQVWQDGSWNIAWMQHGYCSLWL